MSALRVKEVSAAELAALAAGEVPVLVDFYATWCGPCRVMAPVVERAAAQLAGLAEVVKINVDDFPEAAAAHGVRGVPTFVGLAGGIEVGRAMGTISEEALVSVIEPALSERRDVNPPSAAA